MQEYLISLTLYPLESKRLVLAFLLPLCLLTHALKNQFLQLAETSLTSQLMGCKSLAQGFHDRGEVRCLLFVG